MAADGWIPVETTKEMDDIGRWAVNEYNRKTGRCLIYRRVVAGWKFVLGRGLGQETLYALLLECADGGSIGYYGAVVGVLCREKRLLFFQLLFGWKDVKYLQSSIETENYSRFAIDEYSKQQKRLIIFRRVVAAQQQEVAGVNYRLIIECEDANRIKLYEAVVYVKGTFKSLEDFKPLDLYNKQQVIDALETTAGTKVAEQWVQMQPDLVGY